jgi:hypothetical protein
MSTETPDNALDTQLGALGVQGEGEPKTPPATPSGEPPTGEELDENGEPKKKMGGFQKRIQRLNTRLAAVEEENARLRASAAPAAAAPGQETLTEPQPPDESKFHSYADYKAAERKYFSDLADYKAEQKIQARDKAKATETEAAKAREKQAEVRESWSKRLEAAHEAHPDLEELLEDDLPTTPTMQEFLMASAHGGEMLHHLASHPAECRRIAGLTPRGAEIALARIEDEISAKTPSTTPQKRTTSAPAPLQPLKGSGTAGRDPASIKDDNEWYLARNAQRKR